MKTVTLTADMVHSGDLILVNRDYPIKCQNNSISSTMTWYTKIINKLRAWDSIRLVSGWRSYDEQRRIYNDSLTENGTEFTAKYVALPGHSEHQTGLALDVGLNQADIDFIAPHFPYTGICERFRTLAARLGFVERYPEGKEGITGIAHEPWHFRYVGVPHAVLITRMGITLEEYHIMLKDYPYGGKPLICSHSGKETEIFYLAADKSLAEFTVRDNAKYTVSGNNMDGFVVSLGL